MTPGTTAADAYEQFATAAREYGIEPTRIDLEEVAETLHSLVEQPAVGTPLPWDGAELPAFVETEVTPAALDGATTGITAASLAIAEYGTLVLETDEFGSEPVSLFVDVHVAVVHEDDIVPDTAAAFEYLGEELRETRGSAVLATGPSATADMGALVEGAHGPRDVEVLVVT